MATNIVATSAYQLNQHPIPLAQVTQVGFPTATTTLFDCSTSPNTLLPTGIAVYSFGQLANGDKYYFQQTLAQMVALFNA